MLKQLTTIAFFLSIFLSVFALPAKAQTVDVVSGLSVSATSSSASKAKKQAFMTARKQAISHIYVRMGYAEPTEIPDDLALKATSFIEVINEQTAGNFYQAKLKVGILREQLFATEDPSATDQTASYQGPPWVLVVPVHLIDGEAFFWKKSDQWSQEWDMPRPRKQLSLITTTGDAEDRMLFPKEEASHPSSFILSQLADKYKAPAVAVVKLVQDQQTLWSSLETIYWSPATGMMIESTEVAGSAPYKTAYEYSVTAIRGFATQPRKDSPFKGYAAQQYQQQNNPYIPSSTTPAWETNPGYDQAVRGQKSVVPFSIPISSLQDWIKIQGKLRTIPELEVEVLSVTRSRVELKLHYPYPAQQLTQVINQYGVLD